jgi:hypothetical protein
MPVRATTPCLTSEAEARACVEERLGTRFTDEEWASHKARLLAFMRLLQSWEKNPGSD